MIDFNGLVSEFKRIGLTTDDVVLIHSSFKSFGGVHGGPQTVINALISVVGTEGTLIFPRFNFDFSTSGTPWDVRSTPSIIARLLIVSNNGRGPRLLSESPMAASEERYI